METSDIVCEDAEADEDTHHTYQDTAISSEYNIDTILSSIEHISDSDFIITLEQTPVSGTFTFTELTPITSACRDAETIAHSIGNTFLESYYNDTLSTRLADALTFWPLPFIFPIPAHYYNTLTGTSVTINCLNNVMMENFFELMKSELLYLQEWDSVEQFAKEVVKYISYYNNDRIKLRLKGKSPVQYRALFQSKSAS